MDNGIKSSDLENLFLQKAVELEGLIIQKTKVYSRLLTSIELAEELEKISQKREKSRNAWLEILTGEPQKNSGNEQTEMSSTAQGEWIMQLEKQKITLNERDSLLDVLYSHERLAETYLQGAQAVDRKEVRELLKKRLCEVLDEIYFLKDLIKNLQNWQE